MPSGQGRIAGLGIRGRSLAVVALVSLLIGAVSLGSLYVVGGNIAEKLGYSVAERYVLGHKARVEGFMQRELTLARRLADSPPVQRWARAEEDPAARAAALDELASLRDLFSGDSYFVVLADSGHYYFKGPEGGDEAPPRITQTLSRSDPKDSWFFDALEGEAPYHLNVDFNRELRETKVWFNVIMRDGDARLGVAGTGVDISHFVRQFVQTEEPGLQAILLNRKGAIQGHENVDNIALNAQVTGTGAGRTALWGHIPDGQRPAVRRHMERLRTGEQRLATFPLTLDGRPRLAALAYLPELDWFTLASLDPQAVLGWPEFLAVAGVLVVALLLALALLGLLFNRFLLQPVAGLARAAEGVARGEYDTQLPEDRRDELGTLAHTFNNMARTVQEYTGSLEERVRERTADLQEANTALGRTNRMLLESISSARRIQEALLPGPGSLEGLPLEHFALWLPRDRVGGDLYVIRQAGDGLLVGVMDCTGHGVPGAVTVMAAHSAFNHAVDRGGLRSPGPILASLNRELRDMLNPESDGADTRGSDNGLEMALCRWEPGADTLRFAATRLSLYRARAGEIEEWAGDRTGLGYRAADPGHRFTEHDVAVEAGDTFYLATDGFLDQGGGPKGLPFGRQRLRTLLAEQAETSLADQRAALVEALAEWQGEREQRDDVTVLGFRPSPRATGPDGRRG
ncbi:SpoIIE family protein phosphatase [Thiohalorhabdus methylotrophus]|uniref:SpoIIE family protein phosphatase n=1 Tax=Thiohalorhabdus methylotrophus TaxID=3242694 RepID=A0ABV4TSP4_9GAMM